jgi:cell division protein FtsW
MRLSRADRSRLSEWWFTVDHVLLAAIFILLGAGLVLSLAAGPAVAIKKGLPPYYFVERHALYSLLSAATILALSLLSPRALRRLALMVFLAALVLMVSVLMTGPEINGARRWFRFAGYSLQPSELAKPAFIVLSAWLLSEACKRPEMPARGLSVGLFVVFAGLLVLQPDIGQALLISLVFLGLLFLSGLAVRWVAALAGAGVVGLGLAYVLLSHVRARIDRFLDPASGDSYQTDRAAQSFSHGGLFGRGPGEGTIKSLLPDSHTDFIFAVIAEEYGILACLVLLGLFAFIALRALWHVVREPDAFVRYAAAGLVLAFVAQACINMAVNVGLLPAKGMTLPFISYGGSSLLASGLAMGFLLALTRRRPQALRPKNRTISGSTMEISNTEPNPQ